MPVMRLKAVLTVLVLLGASAAQGQTFRSIQPIFVPDAQVREAMQQGQQLRGAAIPGLRQVPRDVVEDAVRRIYAAALEGHFVAQVFYMLIITDALHAITHHTQWFISPWVHMSIFLMPALYYARDFSRGIASGDSMASVLLEKPGHAPVSS